MVSAGYKKKKTGSSLFTSSKILWGKDLEYSESTLSGHIYVHVIGLL